MKIVRVLKKHTLRLLLPVAAILTCALPTFAEIPTATQIFDSNFRTLKVSNPDNFFAPGVIRLGTNDRLVISFDEIADDRSYLRYRIIHCNADWQPSNLVESEYVDGFNEAEVSDYAYSSNTFVRFVNYRIEIPNPDMQPLLSGNYLLQVYDEDDRDTVLLQARFSVAEPLVKVDAKASTNTDLGFNGDWQQLSVTLTPGNYRIRDPYTDLILVAEQNQRTDNVAVVMHPQRVSGDNVVYEHVKQLIFPAGNEYRRFETVRVDYNGMHVDSARYMGSNYHHFLTPDYTRSDHGYLYDQTQQGRFLVREYNATNSDLGADYVTVHFTLRAPYMPDRDVYVDGEMTHGLFTPANRMNYNTDTQAYELQMPLKQGSYNYQYLTLPRSGKGPASFEPVEGNKYETRNEYLIKVYQREPGSRYDRLVGFAQIYSY